MWSISVIAVCLVCVTYAERPKAIAVLRNPEKGIDGTVKFEETDDGILVHVNITGLTPGAHGFHVHDKGDVSDPKCTSAGGHFNPFNMKHGKRDDEVRHIGDLGNILSNEEKKAEESFFDKHISFKGETNIIGKVLVVHADADDYGRGTFADSPITGNSGEKIACGIIERSSSPRHLATVLAIFLPILILTIRN